MSRKRINKTINPQIAVQDYLDDLLQEPLSTSPLETLVRAEQKQLEQEKQKEKQKKIDAAAKAKKAKAQATRATVSVSDYAYGAAIPKSAAYSEAPTKSLASQRLEEKRARGRAPEKQFREPLELKSSLALSRMLKAIPPHEPDLKENVVDVVNPVTLSATVEQPVTDSIDARVKPVVDDKELTPKHNEGPIEAREQSKTVIDTGAEPDYLDGKIDSQSTEGVAADFAEPVDEWMENGRPVWAQNRFECLIFTVAGLKLAVPLVALGAIHAMEQELTPLVGRPGWFLGLLPIADRNIRVVDSAQWIMPERYHDKVKEDYRFVIRLDNSEWGMACDSVAQSFSISPDEVRWRTDRGKRPWLAGTVIDHMCALMDVAAVSRLLDKAEKTNESPI